MGISGILSAIFLVTCLALGCASKDLPLSESPSRLPASTNAPGANAQSTTKSLKKERLRKMDVYSPMMYASGKRLLEQDCLMYKEPNLYSERLSKVNGGREVWTEETGLSWYKVYRQDGVGYLSKICFKN